MYESRSQSINTRGAGGGGLSDCESSAAIACGPIRSEVGTVFASLNRLQKATDALEVILAPVLTAPRIEPDCGAETNPAVCSLHSDLSDMASRITAAARRVEDLHSRVAL